jgi:beta-phosphoglucomutase-like phosphatase (HAD superfamily)
VLSSFGIHIDEQAYFDTYLGLDDAGAFRVAFERNGTPIDAARIAELIAAKKPIYRARAEQTLTGFPKAAELLKARAEVGPVVVVSGALHDEIEMGLSVLGVRDLVAHIVSAERTSRSKPDPEGYLLGVELLRELGQAEPKRDAIVFEDSVDGIRAAKAAGLCCLGIGHSYPLEKLQRAGADASVERIADVSQTLLSDLHATWQTSVR